MECSREHQEIGCQTLESMVGSTKTGPTERKPRPADMQAQRCPRCDSTNTKFCYYNNYSLSQPRYLCKSCRRYWTKGGTIRNVPVGGGCRRKTTATKRTSSSSSKKTLPVEVPHQYPSGNLQILQTDNSSRGMTWIPRPLGDLDSGLPLWRRLGEPGGQPFHSGNFTHGMMGLSFGWGTTTGSEVGTSMGADIRGLMWSSPLPEVGRDGNINMVDGRTVAGWGGIRPYNWQGVLSSPLM